MFGRHIGRSSFLSLSLQRRGSTTQKVSHIGINNSPLPVEDLWVPGCTSLAQDSLAVLRTSDPLEKAEKAILTFERWNTVLSNNQVSPQLVVFPSRFESTGDKYDLDQTTELLNQIRSELSRLPGRPLTPVLVEPKLSKNHKQLNCPLNVWLLHALAHIEVNAIDLAFDLIARWSPLALSKVDQQRLLNPAIEKKDGSGWFSEAMVRKQQRSFSRRIPEPSRLADPNHNLPSPTAPHFPIGALNHEAWMNSNHLSKTLNQQDAILIEQCAREAENTDQRVQLPLLFFSDWLRVGADEARHFQWLSNRLENNSSHYGALEAHTGLWNTAQDTTGDLVARLAAVPLIQEAKGLDAHQRLVSKLVGSGDNQSAAIVDRICSEEVPHVETGFRWFNWLCKERFGSKVPPASIFHTAVKLFVPGGFLLPPIHHKARAEAGMNPSFYQAVVFRENPSKEVEKKNVQVANE